MSSNRKTWLPFYGIIWDVRQRAPYFVSDWVDAWNYRVSL